MTNLLNIAKGLMTTDLLDKVADLIGSDTSTTRSAMSRLMPALLGGLVKKGTSGGGASILMGLLTDHKLGGSTMDDLSDLLDGGGGTDDLMSLGSKLNEAIFGSSLSGISRVTGMTGDTSSKLMDLATPMLMGSLGKIVEDKGLDASGLQGFLESQRSHVTTAMGAVASAGRSGRGSIMRWLIPLFLFLSAAWFFLQGKKEKAATPAPANVEQPTTPNKTHKHTHTHADGTVHEGHAHEHHHDHAHDHTHGGEGASIPGNVMGMFVDESGNLIKDGQLLLKQGEFTLKNGEFLDASGNSLGHAKGASNTVQGMRE